MSDIIVKKPRKRRTRPHVEPGSSNPPADLQNHRAPIYTHPETEHFAVHLSSEHAISYMKDAEGNLSTSGYTTNIEDILHLPNEDYELNVSLMTAEIPVAWYVVNSSNNKVTIKMSQDGSFFFPPQTSFEIPPGNYSEEQLCSELQELMLDHVYYPNLELLTRYNSRSDKMTLYLQRTNPTDTNTYRALFTFGEGSIGPLLGMTSNQVSIVTGGNSKTGDVTMKMRLHRTVYVETNLGSLNVYHPKNKAVSNILAKILIDQPYNSIQKFVPPTDFKTRVKETNLKQFIIKLVDEQGQLVEMNGEHWSITLQVAKQRREVREQQPLLPVVTQKESNRGRLPYTQVPKYKKVFS